MMDIAVLFQKLCRVEIRRLLMVMGIVVSGVVVFQFFALPFGKIVSLALAGDGGSIYTMAGNISLTNISSSDSSDVFRVVANNTDSSDSEEESGNGKEAKGNGSNDDFASDKNSEDKDRNSKNEVIVESGVTLDKRLTKRNVTSKEGSSDQVRNIELRHGPPQLDENSNTNVMPSEDRKSGTDSDLEEERNRVGFGSQPPVTPEISIEKLNPDSRNPILYVASNSSSIGNVTQTQSTETQSKDKNAELLQTAITNYLKKRSRNKPTSISQMNLLLVQNAASSMRPRWSSARDRELLSAKLQIENAPIVRNPTELYASLYRNVSMFVRSYELMERVLKVYIYREGEKPIFHESKMDGIYASEGWFIKLMKGNKQFVVKDPKKAHLFYLPFSSKNLRSMLDEQNMTLLDEQNRSLLHEQKLRGWKDLQNFLDNYVDMIAAKYRFWNRTGGTDHFLVACHDWAPRITKQRMKNCIRALCNSNAGTDRGFKIGKDTSLPVTYVKGGNPLRDLGGKPAAERSTLAFFAGNMHGYLRPVLLQYWENKEPDMKIFGPMPRDTNGTAAYKEHMKSSKFCICAKGYEVHTPRVVEAILYECVPVIIADNYVPPFFEVLDWESFAVFVPEDDIPNLRNILLSIPEEKYFAMQSRVKVVQQHFLWHKQPLKYDLFHMILHSIWNNRLFQMKTR